MAVVGVSAWRKRPTLFEGYVIENGKRRRATMTELREAHRLWRKHWDIRTGLGERREPRSPQQTVSVFSGGGGFNMGEDPRRRPHLPGTCDPNATADVAMPPELSARGAFDEIRRRAAARWERLLLCHSQT
jgi:hypothetical protein